MDKLKMHSPDLSQENIAKIRELFPGCVTEARDDKTGKLRLAVDFDQLKQELSDHIVEGPQERYRLDWPGKREALALANAPIAKALRPSRAESVDFDSTRNLFIEGDNLEALKLLQESYLGQVKLIYIDPPYNTGRDFIYDDDYKEDVESYLLHSNQVDKAGVHLVANTDANGRFHSDWMSMIYARLRLARNLLRDDGVIFISIDDNEVDNLRKVCSEIFGESNFIAQIIWQKVYAPKNTADWFSEDHDYILVFAKNRSAWRPEKLPRTAEMEARYRNPDNDPRGPWKAENMSARNRYDAGIYPVTCPSGRIVPGPPTGNYWRINEKKFNELNSDGRIWWGSDGNNTPSVKKFLSEVASGRTPQTLWFYKEVGHTQDAKKSLLNYVPFQHTENVLNSVKPVELLQRILQLAGKPDQNAIVLDFFSGSAPTAHAVLKQNAEDGGNRRFIAVQIAETLPKPEPGLGSIFEMGLTRVRNVIAELRNQEGADKLDLGFRVLKVDTSNMKDVFYRPDQLSQADLFESVDNVKPDRSAEDLLFQVLVDWGVDLSLPIRRETLHGKTVFFVDDNALVACFDQGISEELVKGLAKAEPLRVVFRDNGFASDALKINVEQIFRQLSPSTEVRTL
ncbi:site-specific DNA-methyltransferase [Pseudomonas stutzeri]|jgi:adenine-specific DNA-methyltransferase|uniref:site-specific DNA-methyltransferase n=2 Tax=Stutzerimonas stutzeri TaxID=316 RepID=UPI000DABD98C|nr:site-specific DNA-methyltransferase [Stutzerimonas stutzeri]NMY66622.1 site-specific DNA-methyltransferase [Pseudomonas sp. WS 5018]HAB85818.1 site-specific DNA-methyltransferase [Pseudomonas sp.]MBH3356213.1 site-specific DNA-methyltransferase [Stutzerimonas stutzeri]MCF0014486.1 site-specific DNA-methyltransferase [Stutzerimonas stutzeri]MCF0020840.1 site-specific DNA-methyltransferase [Stutzerimonas stutzeri]